MIGSASERSAGADRRRGRGQALLEFAVVLPIFLLIAMILLDFGRVVYAQHTITQDAREAGRNAAVGAEFTQAKYDAIRAAGLRMSPGVPLTAADITGDPAMSCSAVAATLALPGVDDALSPGSCFYPAGIGDRRIEIRISITVQLLTPIISNVVGGSYNITARTIAYVQSVAN